ncbi:50S ribosomal protein L6 [Candidatus Roizmanbacteria bacterium CG_4_10_14_0_2_um_filter_36_35]|uniref:50S ribosomal protein L6 n=4 Tax=Candidatus Roizmaniibacteriota TaxID=1752723 RepID=A0A2M7BXH9_9BACT|nr:MAG: 50S ribosomal protein L6 [Candidatus Roizmanbacteria bacterium CG11_big_fil_rev_8_21_14_0_20_35_14]PIV11283.1 MAG: 50S ribosomal protein L6 [Candidatus Roizmanbacteria bacterium CG03_land_8_20_14_0_80_35_26]PIZ67404.1 MAG: 50S ribosomal protein L6 [Candidatus Roizmanbacteria bacterium CG_4_10_14_0_2_um_filter_36_35]PJC32964.1 MAG: 50S ribosomal protein L6 [Candidatus Roizmanbacteria bacterium CG_4_9_14_0_2_um_filter_36_12]PJC80469.1 MAG: 50S ribosomal protein L6 [Candidatus Roizmanbacte
MSKIGEKTIEISQGVSVSIDKKKINVKGPHGELTIELPDKLEILTRENNLLVKRNDDEKKTKSIHGLYRQLINNAILGVQKLWEKKLKVVGTGYTVKLDKEDLVFKIGYSHPVVFKKTSGVKFQVEGNNKVVVLGCDKQLVGEIAYQIKILKKPDVYKGKGIQYEGEKLRIKPGKKAKVAGGTVA